jgi:phospholipid transport system substrate-binding protein
MTTLAPALATLALSVLAAAPPTAPSPTGAAEATIRKTVDAAFVVLRDKTLVGKEQRARRIASLRTIADQTFDWSEMARSSLGVQWRSLNDQQRRRFVEVFKDILAAEYMDDIDRFQGTETVTVDKSTRQGDDVLVHTTLLTASRERVPIDYRLMLEQDRWMVVDLSIEEVSLVNHFRKTFSGALANMTIDELIAKLRRQLPTGAAASN